HASAQNGVQDQQIVSARMILREAFGAKGEKQLFKLPAQRTAFFIVGRRGSRTAAAPRSNRIEMRPQQLHQFMMFNRTRYRYYYVSGTVGRPLVISEKIPGHPLDALHAACNRHAEWITGPEAFIKKLMKLIIRTIFKHPDLLKNDLSFVFHFIFGKPRIEKYVRHEIESFREEFGKHLDVI